MERKGVVSASDLEEAKRLINEYCQTEFGEEASFEDLSNIGIAYTTTELYGIPVQANVDLIRCQIVRYLGSRVIEERKFDSIRKLIDNELRNLDFDDLTLVSDEDEQEEAYFREVMM